MSSIKNGQRSTTGSQEKILLALRRCKLLRGWEMCVETKLRFTFCLQLANALATREEKSPRTQKGPAARRVLSHSRIFISKLEAHIRDCSLAFCEGSAREGTRK